MRILHVVDSAARRGAETFAADLVAALRHAGLEQRVAVVHGPARNGGLAYAAPTRVLYASSGRHRLALPGLRLDACTLWRLRLEVDAWRPDVVQDHGGDSLKYAGLATVGLRAELVHRMIGAPGAWVRGKAHRAAYARLLCRAAITVAVAEAVREETRRLLDIPSTAILTIPNGVDAARLAPSRDREATRRVLGIPPAAPVLLGVGALTVEKDPLGQLELAAALLADRPDGRYLVAGDGPLRQELEAAVRARGLGGRVALLGTRADVADLLAAGDLLLVASRTEGMPACVIEAGMVGLPVAGYALAGIPEVVVDGVTGVLTPPGDLSGLARRAAALLDDEAARRRMGEAAKARCRALFEIRPIARRYLELYERVLNS
jgi:glycosyltransferase involved in cell wall biosynthesis